MAVVRERRRAVLLLKGARRVFLWALGAAIETVRLELP